MRTHGCVDGCYMEESSDICFNLCGCSHVMVVGSMTDGYVLKRSDVMCDCMLII